MEKNKRYNVITIIAIILAVIATVLLSVSCNNLQDPSNDFNVTTFNSDIVIKRIDGKEPLNMPYRYAIPVLSAGFKYGEEIAGINVSSVRYSLNNSLSLSGFEGVLVNADSGAVRSVMDSIKYCKGITTLSGIISDKENCKITIYEGYTEDLLAENLQHYAIIPSTLSEHINNELPDYDKVFSLTNIETNGLAQFRIIGEYTTKKEQNTLYLSFTGLSKVIAGEQKDIAEHVDCLEIDVNEEKDLTDFTFFLFSYFADYNMLSQYSNRINILNEPYPYMFVNSVDIKPIVLTEEDGFKKNIITISRIDGKENLNMSHMYADRLVWDYNIYSRYITDLIISTGVKGFADENNKPYGLKVEAGGVLAKDWREYRNEKGIMEPQYHQLITSISEIKNNKKNCQIFFYGNYTNRDLVVQREEDRIAQGTRRGATISGYAIVPAPMYESVKKQKSTDYQIVELYEVNENISYIGFACGFKVIGYYKLPEDSTDEYDTVYITYTGASSKYGIILGPYINEYIESITIETRSDADMGALTDYLKKYFAPKDAVDEYIGLMNGLGLDYEYCYTILKDVD